MTVEGWGTRLTEDYCRGVASLFERGELLIAAKEALGHGRFAEMFARRLIPYSQRTAERLMQIAKSQVLQATRRNPTRVAILPESQAALLVLATLPPDALLAALDAGKVHADMERDDALRLRPLAMAVAQDIGADADGFDQDAVQQVYRDFCVDGAGKEWRRDPPSPVRHTVSRILRTAVAKALRQCRKADRGIVDEVLLEIVEERRRDAAPRDNIPNLPEITHANAEA